MYKTLPPQGSKPPPYLELDLRLQKHKQGGRKGKQISHTFRQLLISKESLYLEHSDDFIHQNPLMSLLFHSPWLATRTQNIMQICSAVKGLDEPFSLYTRSSEEILREKIIANLSYRRWRG